MKLQQAYFSEASKAGGWQLIGYQAPNGGSTTNFTYSGDITAAGSDALDAAKVGWFAAGNVNLNECAKVDSPTSATAPWKVSLSKSTVSATGMEDVAFTASVTAGGCTALTPTFDKIGK